MKSYQPFWFNQALAETECSSKPPLSRNINSDICIVGGGYTGLWTAIKIKQHNPNKSVVVVEKGLCGQGASGRNGGCMLTFATKFSTLQRLFGTDEAIRLVQASEQAVFDIAEFCKQHSVDADVRVDGAIYTATNHAQKQSLYQPIELLQQHNINKWHKMDTDEAKVLSGSNSTLAAITTDAAGSLHPGKLVLGLKKVALKLGVEIYENTPMEKLHQGKNACVETPHGKVNAGKVILALNAWMGKHFQSFNRHYVLVSSDMIITKPQPQLLTSHGLDHGKAIADSRIFVHYYRTSKDGRLMLGKGGNLFAYGNKMLPAFDQESRYKSMLTTSFKKLFPTLQQDFETTWTGASDRSATGLPFFGKLNGHNNILYGLGYSGNGVVQSFLGGDILSSMALELDNEWANSGLAKGPLGSFPPEPIRYLGSRMVKNAILRKERFEDNHRTPFWFDKQLAKFAAAAGKADK